MASVYEIIKENPAAVLPDQSDVKVKDGSEWVAGAYEGTLLRSDYSIKQHVWVNYRASSKVKAFILNPGNENMSVVEDTVTKYSAISLVDPVISFLSRSKFTEDQLSKAGLKLATESSKREAVKLGIALLGRTKNTDVAAVVEELSYCDEFTLYGIVALKNILPKEEADSVLLRIGEKVSGWGKIALMYELDYDKEDVREWTLKYGCANSIGLSYLANVCAIKGKMADFLENTRSLDSDMFKGICNIFRGLLERDSANDSIYEYPDAKKASQRFRELTEKDPAQKSEASDILDNLMI